MNIVLRTEKKKLITKRELQELMLNPKQAEKEFKSKVSF